MVEYKMHEDIARYKIVQTRIEFIKIWEENTVQLRNWEYDDEGPSWSNTKSLKTLARYSIQKA